MKDAMLELVTINRYITKNIKSTYHEIYVEFIIVSKIIHESFKTMCFPTHL